MGRVTTIGAIAALGLGAALLAAPAMARPIPDGGMTAGEIADWLRAGGYTATVKPDPTTAGDQIVSTTTDGTDVDIYLYDCNGDGDARRCTSMQYAAGWAPSATINAARANEWNRSKRYIKAYVTEGGSLYGEYDLDLSPGGTTEMLDDTLQNWRRNVVNLRGFFDAPPG